MTMLALPQPFTAVIEPPPRSLVDELVATVRHLHLRLPGPLSPDTIALLQRANREGLPLSVHAPLPWDDPRRLIGHLKEYAEFAALILPWPLPRDPEAHRQFELAWGSGLPIWFEPDEEMTHPSLDALLEDAQRCRVKGVRIAPHAGPEARRNEPSGGRAAPHRRPCLAPDGVLPHRELAGITSCFLTAAGELRPCRHESYSFGSALTDGIGGCWNSARARAWRRRHLPRHPGTGAGTPAPSPPMLLHESLAPLPRYRLVETARGALLVGDSGHLLPLSAEGIAFARGVNGRATLSALRRSFGSEGLSFVFFLYTHGLAAFRRGAA